MGACWWLRADRVKVLHFSAGGAIIEVVHSVGLRMGRLCVFVSAVEVSHGGGFQGGGMFM